MYATIELSESGHQNLPREFESKGSVYGQNLPKMVEELDALAEKAGVKPISSFFDDSEMLSEEEREEAGLPPAEPKWLPVEEGLRTVQALITSLAAAGASEAKRWDLQVSEQILSSAVGRGETFRYTVA